LLAVWPSSGVTAADAAARSAWGGAIVDRRTDQDKHDLHGRAEALQVRVSRIRAWQRRSLLRLRSVGYHEGQV
jgi:hypothetical protein